MIEINEDFTDHEWIEVHDILKIAKKRTGNEYLILSNKPPKAAQVRVRIGGRFLTNPVVFTFFYSAYIEYFGRYHKAPVYPEELKRYNTIKKMVREFMVSFGKRHKLSLSDLEPDKNVFKLFIAIGNIHQYRIYRKLIPIFLKEAENLSRKIQNPKGGRRIW